MLATRFQTVNEFVRTSFVVDDAGLLIPSPDEHHAIDHIDRRRLQCTTTGSSEAATTGDIEGRSMGRTDDPFAANQELAGRVVEPPTGMGADVVVSENGVTASQYDQIGRFAIDRGFDGDRAAVGNGIAAAQAVDIFHH